MLVTGVTAAVGQTPHGPEIFAKDIAAFVELDRRNAFPEGGVLFVGSSSIRMWPTRESFPDLPVINRGFGGSYMSDTLHYADKIVLPHSPRVIVLYEGDNDVQDGKSPEDVHGDFVRLVEFVHGKLPKTHLVYIPIKPSIARWEKWPTMQAANAAIEKTCAEDARLHYVDVATPMIGADGKPRGELFLDDGLHMNAKGYAEWSEVIGPLVKTLLKETAAD